MASETFANRATLRARLRSRLGMSTDDAVMAQTTNQHNELLRGAARYVRDLCTWKRLESEYLFNTSVDERFYTYPANSGVGDALRLSRLDDSGHYIELQKRVIMPALDVDDALSGDEDEATRGTPLLFEERSVLVSGVPAARIELWPPADVVYGMKLDYIAGGEGFSDDVTLSVVDAELILYWALGDAYEARGDLDLADRQRDKFEVRRRELHSAGNVGGVITIDRARETRLQYGYQRDPTRPTPTNPTISPFP
jgi:hypothetical protein